METTTFSDFLINGVIIPYPRFLGRKLSCTPLYNIIYIILYQYIGESHGRRPLVQPRKDLLDFSPPGPLGL